MRVAGIDTSSFHIDAAFIDLDTMELDLWMRWDLHGQDAWERCRSIATAVPGPTAEIWDDVLAVGVEVAHGMSSGIINRCVGAVLTRLPLETLVEPWNAPSWKKAAGLPGNASKAQIASYAVERIGYELGAQDAYDAWGLAMATVSKIEVGPQP